jgi:hypothetical protein
MERGEIDAIIAGCETWARRSALDFTVKIGSPATDLDLDRAERSLAVKFPDDFRTWYGICDEFECRVGPLLGVQILSVPNLNHVVEGSQRLCEILADAYADSDKGMPPSKRLVLCGYSMEDDFLMGPMSAGDLRQQALPVVRRDERVLDSSWPTVANSFDEWLRRSLESLTLTGRFDYFET